MANSNSKVQLKTGPDWYALVVDGEESDPCAIGEPLEFTTVGGKRFLAVVEANGDDLEALTEFWAYEVLPVVDVPILEDEDEDDDDDNNDDDLGAADDEEDEDEETKTGQTV